MVLFGLILFTATPGFARGLYSVPKQGAILGVSNPDRALRSCMKKQEAEFSRAEHAYPDQAFFKRNATEVDTDVIDFRDVSSSEVAEGQIDEEVDAEVYGVQDGSEGLYLVLNSTARLMRSGECKVTSAKTIMQSFDRWKANSKALTETVARTDE